MSHPPQETSGFTVAKIRSTPLCLQPPPLLFWWKHTEASKSNPIGAPAMLIQWHQLSYSLNALKQTSCDWCRKICMENKRVKVTGVKGGGESETEECPLPSPFPPVDHWTEHFFQLSSLGTMFIARHSSFWKTLQFRLYHF